MAMGRTGQMTEHQRGDATSSRAVNLEGDSPEVVAFALLRYLAQLEHEQTRETGVVFDREWLLDAYADCLDAVKGNRNVAAQDVKPPAKAAAKGR
ncbi:hypothetical protein ACD578_27650 (plasmid) [Microvirga sp. RSM25]|uniref:hypothetical protein n=1 Tax=Microvirga sp. RSM25 TaxID=3273802 RepID=UPI00384C4400